MDRKIISKEVRSLPVLHTAYENGHVAKDFYHVVVLVEGKIGDYAAYEAIVRVTLIHTQDGVGEWVDSPHIQHSLQWVAQHGHKLTFKQATQHFSGIEESKYRR